MSKTYSLNEHGEVVPYDCGRKANDTRLYREPTEFELQLLEQIKELESQLDKAEDIYIKTDIKKTELEGLLREVLPIVEDNLIDTSCFEKISICDKCNTCDSKQVYNKIKQALEGK